MAHVDVQLDLNRVEGDLSIGVTLEDGVVAEARAIGTLYLGFEQMLVGRAPRDAMVITPRASGMCSTAHLYAAVLALEQVWRLPVPANATRIRNLCLMAETIQHDLRQTFLFSAPNFCNSRYAGREGFDELARAFEPFQGDVYRETLAMTRHVLEIVAHFGGQWPHSSHMLPGGVVVAPDMRRVLACRAVLDDVAQWYETRIIGVPLDEWLALDSAGALLDWLRRPGPAAAALGRMTRFARALGLHRVGAGTPHMVSFGAWCDPERWGPPHDAHLDAHLLPGGFFDGETGRIAPLDQALIGEHVRYSWFRPYPGARHPYEGETVPDYQPGTVRYTWAKAPRYGGRVAQTGALAELLIGGDALVRELCVHEGGSAWLRQFACVRRIAHALRQGRRMLDGLTAHAREPHFLALSAGAETDGQGCGLVMAASGALGHWIKLKDGVIEKYQIITPTEWNASPRDSNGVPGHWEQSLIGLRLEDPGDPVEVSHVISP